MKKLLIVVAALLFSTIGFAQVVQVKGVGTVSYKGDLSPGVKEQAYMAAQVAAIERYFAENGEAESQNFEAIEDKIKENLEKFILSTSVVNEQDQPSVRKYSVAVRIELNVAKMRNTIRGSSGVAKASAGAKSQLAYVFVGREISSVKAFDVREVKRVEATEKSVANNSRTTRGSEGESITDTSISTSAGKQVRQNNSQDYSLKVETGGSRMQKADEKSYRLLPMANVKTSITSVFSQGGFKVADAEFILGDKDFKVVTKDYSNGNDLAPATLRSVVASMKKSQVPVLILATLDVGAPSQDPATGMQRVAVTVTGRVLDLSGPLPNEIASVPPQQFFGVGPDNSVAAEKGLKEASLAAAREVVSRLNAAGIQ